MSSDAWSERDWTSFWVQQRGLPQDRVSGFVGLVYYIMYGQSFYASTGWFCLSPKLKSDAFLKLSSRQLSLIRLQSLRLQSLRLLLCFYSLRSYNLLVVGLKARVIPEVTVPELSATGLDVPELEVAGLGVMVFSSLLQFQLLSLVIILDQAVYLKELAGYGFSPQGFSLLVVQLPSSPTLLSTIFCWFWNREVMRLVLCSLFCRVVLFLVAFDDGYLLSPRIRFIFQLTESSSLSLSETFCSLKPFCSLKLFSSSGALPWVFSTALLWQT